MSRHLMKLRRIGPFLLLGLGIKAAVFAVACFLNANAQQASILALL